MKVAILAAALVLFSSISFAQAPPPGAPPPPDQTIQDINADWSVLQVGQQHLLKSIQVLVTDREKLKADLKAAQDEVAKLKQEKAAAPPK